MYASPVMFAVMHTSPISSKVMYPSAVMHALTYCAACCNACTTYTVHSSGCWASPVMSALMHLERGQPDPSETEMIPAQLRHLLSAKIPCCVETLMSATV